MSFNSSTFTFVVAKRALSCSHLTFVILFESCGNTFEISSRLELTMLPRLSSKLSCGCFPFPMQRRSCENCWASIPNSLQRMFSRKVRSVVFFQRLDVLMHARSWSAFVPFWTTGRHCRKSPDKTTVFPPIVFVFLQTSWNNMSTASNELRWLIVTSSQMTIFARLITVAISESRVMLLVPTSVAWMFSGSLNNEWAVLAPSSMVAAIPEDALAKATSPDDLISAKMACRT